ncbi:MAG TPA: hypothetical protein VI669_02345 [Vicinamibacteria bacterium]
MAPFLRLSARAFVALVLVGAIPACRSAPTRPPAEPTGPAPVAEPIPAPPPTSDDPLAVTPIAEPFTVAAWAEPAKLPPLGGQCQIIVRVMKRGGAPMARVEVRLQASKGSLYSAGRTLFTDATGKTRDRLTAREGSTITLNAGGTRYRFEVPLTDPLPLPQ